MSSDEDCPPPLEDMTEYVDKLQGKSKSQAKVQYQRVEVVGEKPEPQKQRVVQQKKKKVETGYGGMKKGFLFGKPRNM